MRLRTRTLIALAPLLAGLLPAACLPGGRLPEMARPPASPAQKGGTLAVALAEKGPQPGPFRVTFAGPEGEDVETPQPQIVFSRPVRALSSPRDEPRIEARFTPEVKGRWEWMGSSSARFVATDGFAPATAYTMELSPGIRALDGTALESAIKLSFATLRLSVSGEDEEREHPLRERYILVFSQPVPRTSLAGKVHIADSAGREVPFTVASEGKEWSERVALVPKTRWPEGEELRVSFSPELRGERGTLPLGKKELRFRTERPLHVESVDCNRREDGRCIRHTSLEISLSGDMRASDLKRLVTVSPPAIIKQPSWRDDRPTSSHTFEVDLKPDVRYTVTVAPSRFAPRQDQKREVEELRPLKQGGSAELLVAPDESGVRMSFHGTYLVPPAPGEDQEVAARADDTKKAQVGAVLLDRDLVMKLAAAEEPEPPWWTLPGVSVIPLTPRPSLAAPPGWTSLPGQAGLGHGPVLFGARWDGFKAEESTVRVLQRSDLALYSRVAAEGTLVWITSLRTAEPIAGVAVEARDQAGKSVTGTTDKDGVVTLATADLGDVKSNEGAAPAKRGRARGWMMLFAQRGDDWIYRRVDVPVAPRPMGSLFTDRGLYRPGETVQLKGVVQRGTSKGLVPVTDADVDLAITDPAGRTAHGRVRSGAFGTFNYELPQNADAPLGRYSVAATIDGERLSSEGFRVMEYRPSSFTVEAGLSAKSYVRGDSLVCSGSGQYLYGGSLAGSQVVANFSRRNTTFTVPNLKGFTTAHEAIPGDLPSGDQQRGTLDAAGRRAFPYVLANVEQRTTELITCDVVVTDAGLDAVAASTSALVHPGAVYPALENLRWTRVAPGQILAPKVLAVTPAGERQAALVKVELIVNKVDPAKTWQTLPQKAGECSVNTGKEPVSCNLVAPPGPYTDVRSFVLQGTATDARGNVVTSSVRLYPGTTPKPPPKEKPRSYPHATLEADAPAYEPGNVAKLSAHAPFESSRMLFTVEREGIIEHRVQSVGTEPIPLEVKIDEASAPRVEAHAVFVAPFADKTVRNHTLSAAQHLAVGFQTHRLDVSLVPSKTQAAPGESIDIDIDVHRHGGLPANAEVTLYGADEATLGLAKYQLPMPLDHYYQNRMGIVYPAHTRDDLVWLFDWKEELRAFALGTISTIGHGAGTGSGSGFGSGHGRLGGSHTTKGAEPRRDFRQSAFFFPSLVTDAQGHLRANVKLPESVTTYRLMAFAVTKTGDFGSTQAPVITSMPVQVRPVLPRVIRAGDRFVAAALVANNEAAPRDCSVTLDVRSDRAAEGSTDGAAALPPPLLSRSAAAQRVVLEGRSSGRLTFDLEAKTVGKGHFRFDVACGELHDAAELPFEVMAPTSLEAAAIHGAATGRVDEALGNLDNVRTDVGGLELSVSSSPLAGLGAGLAQLIQYPYGCTEQTTSRLVPLLPLRDLARDLGVALPDDLEPETRAAVKRIEGNQQKDGGFGLWPTSTESSPFLSAYAAWGLEEARRRHVPTDEKVIERARARLLELLAAGDGEGRATAPFALDVLAGTTVTGGMDAASLRVIADQMFERRSDLALSSKAYLLHAMSFLDVEPARKKALADELATGLHLDGPLARYVGKDGANAMLFDSSVRTSALVLRALLAVDPAHPLLTPLALGLVADRKGGTWRTTQETAWALLALDDYRRSHSEGQRVESGEVKLGDRLLLSHRFDREAAALPPDFTKTLSLADLSAAKGTTLSFEGRGDGPLFYQARLRTAAREMPTDEVSAGFEIHRRYFPIPAAVDDRMKSTHDWKREATSFVEGQLVLIEVEVVAPSLRRFVVIEDPLPGGFESVDLALQGGPRWLRQHVHEDATRVEHRDDRILFFEDSLAPGGRHYTHLARATAAGTFMTPPARAEEMYAPETFGRTAGRVLTIK